MAEYQRGQGPNALPQGAASALNAAQPDPLGELAMENTDIPVQFQPGNTVDVPDSDPSASEDLQVLLGAPDANYQAPLFNGSRPGRVPNYVVRHLPELLAAARDPSAPPTLIAVKNAVLRHLDDEARRGG